MNTLQEKVVDRGILSHFVHVIGANLDAGLCRTLIPGDQILAEINGKQISTFLCPLVATTPWIVLENNISDEHERLSGQIVLQHPENPNPLILDYGHCMQLTGMDGEPLVFIEHNKNFGVGTLFVILQMAAFRIPKDQVNTYFPDNWNRDGFMLVLQDQKLKTKIFEDWSARLQGISPQSWDYYGLKRMALRSHIPTSVIQHLKDLNYDELNKVPNADLLKFRQECHWMPYLKRQSNLISHDWHTTYVAGT